AYLVGRLENMVTLSLRRGSVSMARRAANGFAIGKRCNAADAAPTQTRRASSTGAIAAFVKCSHSSAMAAIDRLALAPVLLAERHLSYQAAH
ncbi:MAG: hypothetical protein AAGA68_23840, partial [Pseudomonadota bacterium]